MERLWRHVQCSIPAEVIILRIAAGLIPMPQPPSFDDKESDYEDLRDEMPYSCAIYQRSYDVGTFNFQSLYEFLNIWRYK